MVYYSLEFLRKYRTSRPVDDCDKKSLENLASVGLATFGLREVEDEQGNRTLIGTAWLTKRGKRFYEQEKMMRSPVRRTVRAVVKTLFC